jgi:hypothetical protein
MDGAPQMIISSVAISCSAILIVDAPMRRPRTSRSLTRAHPTSRRYASCSNPTFNVETPSLHKDTPVLISRGQDKLLASATTLRAFARLRFLKLMASDAPRYELVNEPTVEERNAHVCPILITIILSKGAALFVGCAGKWISAIKSRGGPSFAVSLL